TPDDVASLLSCYGIGSLPQEVVTTPAAVGRAATNLGLPVAVKAVAPGLGHTGAVGAVRTDLRSVAAARRAATEVLEAARRAGQEPTGVLVQPMASAGAELLVGVVHDALFGPVVACAAGGARRRRAREVAGRGAPHVARRCLPDRPRRRPAARVCARGRAPGDRRA